MSDAVTELVALPLVDGVMVTVAETDGVHDGVSDAVIEPVALPLTDGVTLADTDAVADGVTDGVTLLVTLADIDDVMVTDGVAGPDTEAVADGVTGGVTVADGDAAATASVTFTRLALYTVLPPTVVTTTVAPLVSAPPLSSTRYVTSGGGVPIYDDSDTKRSVVAGVNANPAAADTVVEMFTQLVPPLVEYCHTPCVPATAAAPTTTTPARALAVVPPTPSAESSKMGVNRAVTVAEGGVPPTVMLPRLTTDAVATGASLTGSTYTGTVWLNNENAVMPPVHAAGTASRPPSVPLVVSHARKVSAAGTAPFQLAIDGRKRMPVVRSDDSSSAEVRDGDVTADQLAPPFSV